MSTTGRAEPEASGAPRQGTAVNSLEQVQEILFGPQVRELARRLSRIDSNVGAQAGELRAEMRRRLDALEIYLRNESTATGTRFESQRSAQADALGSLARETREAIGLLDQRVQRLEETLAQAQREIRQQILDQAKAFIDEVGRTRNELSASVERQIAVAQGEILEEGGPAGALDEADRHDQREAA